jgi:hypothetical protein
MARQGQLMVAVIRAIEVGDLQVGFEDGGGKGHRVSLGDVATWGGEEQIPPTPFHDRLLDKLIFGVKGGHFVFPKERIRADRIDVQPATIRHP